MQKNISNLGHCHLDIKIDNALLNEEDNAVLCDFSGLNFMDISFHTIVAPIIFWPSFQVQSAVRFQGKPFDLRSFGLLALNVLTAYYPLMKLSNIAKVKPDWETEMCPTLKNALKKTKFKHLMRRAFPNTFLSHWDIYEVLHFDRFIMKPKPKKRPPSSRVKMHPFLKTESNPFFKELNDHLKKVT